MSPLQIQPPKKRQHYNFAVGSKYGPRSARWSIRIDGGKDVYITAGGAHRGRFHASLHRSGRWHIKWRNASRDEIVVKAHASKAQGPKVGLFILIPDACLRPASDVARARDPDVWLDRPPYEGAIEIAIMEWNFAHWKPGDEEWPGQKAGYILFAAYCNGPRSAILMLRRTLPAGARAVIEAEKMRPRLKPIVLNSPERRAMRFGTTTHGSLLIIEYAID